MTSLPMPACLPADAMPFSVGGQPDSSRKHGEQNQAEQNHAQQNHAQQNQGEQFLLQAFRSFAEAAESLERSYGSLRSEVARLNAELEQSNAGLQRSLEENRQMRQHLDRILDGLPCGVLVARADGEITLVNPEAKRLLSWTIAQDVAQDAPRDSESSLSLTAGFSELLQRARTESAEQEHYLPDGKRWLAVRHAEIRGAQPEEAMKADCESIFILRDVSEAKRLSQERDQLRREQALAEMSAILAHEIRNPLGSLELFAGLLAGAGLSAECARWVEHLQAGLRTLASTVNNVLHFHRLPAPERMPTDLGQLMDWAGGFLVPLARQARVELCLRNRLHGVRFSADRHRLEQVLLNLVLNALRAMPGGGWVEISGQRIQEGETACAVISVSDTGPGISNGDVGKIFDPGFSTHAGSPGLGLTVCRKIVEQHGGKLEARNKAGAGAMFTLTLRLSPPEEAAKA